MILYLDAILTNVTIRHAGLDPASIAPRLRRIRLKRWFQLKHRCLYRRRRASRWMPDQVRHDGYMGLDELIRLSLAELSRKESAA